jgi:3-phosphoinositide dependent protein kinase-1
VSDKQGDVHYRFEEPKTTSVEASRYAAEDWVESLDRAKDLALSHSRSAHASSDNIGGVELSSTMSSPASTLTGRAGAVYPEGFGIMGDRSGRNQLTKSQGSLDRDDMGNARRNRFSKRQSKSGLGAQF